MYVLVGNLLHARPYGGAAQHGAQPTERRAPRQPLWLKCCELHAIFHPTQDEKQWARICRRSSAALQRLCLLNGRPHRVARASTAASGGSRIGPTPLRTPARSPRSGCMRSVRFVSPSPMSIASRASTPDSSHIGPSQITQLDTQCDRPLSPEPIVSELPWYGECSSAGSAGSATTMQRMQRQRPVRHRSLTSAAGNDSSGGGSASSRAMPRGP